MGGLTLHLARALQAGNPPASQQVRDAAGAQFSGGLTDDAASTLHDYKAERKAVVHTIDVNQKYAEHASRVIGGFRNSLYAPTIEQYVDDVSDWIEKQARQRQETATTTNIAPSNPGEFLHHVILDLPDSPRHMGMAALALRPGGLLILFTPSISQTQDAVRYVRAARLPLVLDDVIELGTNISGGKEWKVELVRIRKPFVLPSSSTDHSQPRSVEDSSEAEESMAESEEDITVETNTSDSPHTHVTLDAAIAAARTPPSAERDARFGMVARPHRAEFAGVGFLAVFRKIWPGEESTVALPRRDWKRRDEHMKHKRSRSAKATEKRLGEDS